MSKKFNLNARQIVKYANKASLTDAICNIDTIHANKGVYNKKVLINVNNFGDKSHKEKYASFYWDMDEALIIADDIINNRFKDTFYMPKNAGFYSQYGGGQMSRILNIGYKEGKYMLQISLFKPIKTKTGAIMPDKQNPIDAHSIQIPEFEMRKFMRALVNHIQAKTVIILSNPLEDGQAPQEPKNEPKPTPTPQPEPKQEESNGGDMFSEFDNIFG